MSIAFAERPPTNHEVERFRLILSTYQDGTGMLATGHGRTLPGWRDFERSVALAFNGHASESKDIFDVRLPDQNIAGVSYGISCKMRRELNRIDKDGRVTIELSNSAKKFGLIWVPKELTKLITRSIHLKLELVLSNWFKTGIPKLALKKVAILT